MQSDNSTGPFGDVLVTVAEWSPRAWLYLPSTRNWSLDSTSAILESDEVPPELEDEPDAGIPVFAKKRNLVQVIPIAVLQDIVANARSQNPDATLDDLFEAFDFYYKNDAFITFV